jgi:hypothetical protein
VGDKKREGKVTLATGKDKVDGKKQIMILGPSIPKVPRKK